MNKNQKKISADVLSRRKALLSQTSVLQVQQLEALAEFEKDEAIKADLTWALERRKRSVRGHIRQLVVSADALDSSSLPVAGGTLVGFKLFIEALGAGANSPLYIVGAVMAAVVWGSLKLNAVRLKSKAEALKTGIGD